MWNSKYEGADGKVHNSISINQSKQYFTPNLYSILTYALLAKIEVLRRPGPKLEENADEQGRE